MERRRHATRTLLAAGPSRKTRLVNPIRRILRLAWPLACIAACGSGDKSKLCNMGAPIACAELGGTWNGGMACRGDSGGWDVSGCVRVSPAKWETVEPATRNPQWATARCNDGTPFDFQVQLAPQPSKVWVIHLAGGAFCEDLGGSCSMRDRALTTTSTQVDRELSAMPAAGIVSRDTTVNPTFATANLVRTTYCSSDLWAGATTDRRPSSGDPVGGWYFSGHANVAALLAVIKERYGLDDSDPETKVLFTGSSAGATGALFNAAVVEAALPAAAADRRVRLLIDAGWTFDWMDPDPAPPHFMLGQATVPDAAVWQHARMFWGATFDPACEARVAEPSTCINGQVWYPHVTARLPVLILQSLVDPAHAGSHGIDVFQKQSAAVAAWKAQAEESLADVRWLFSGNIPYHVLVDSFWGDSSGGLAQGPAGSTFRDVISRFWADGVPERVVF